MVTRVDLGAGVGAACTDRDGGTSAQPYASRNLGGAVGDDPAAVQANRRHTAETLGLAPDRVVWMRQVHGADVAFAEEPFGAAPRVDAVVTTVPRLALAVLVADCAAVLLADPVAGVVGAAHSGRPGTAAGAVPALVTAMRERGAGEADMTAYVGPAVCGSCYEVPAALRDEVTDIVPETYSTTRKGMPGLDIRAGIVAQLRVAGVADVRVDPRCTVETPQLYSYRRDGRTGRFAGYVWLER